MKTFNYLAPILLIFTIAFSSCRDEYKVLRGHGKTVEISVDAGSFQQVIVHDDFKVNISHGSKRSVIIKGYRNLVDYVKAENFSNALTLSFDRREYDNFINTNIEINIVTPELNAVYHSGSSDVNALNFISPNQILLNLNGSGKITLRGCNYRKLESMNYLSGHINAGDLQVKTARCRNNSSGKTTVFANDSLYAGIFGSGNIEYIGNPAISSEIKGSGKLIKK